MVSPSTIQHIGFLSNVVFDGLETLFENDANGNAIYIGRCEPGTTSDEAAWQIKKITYDANDSPTEIRWADSTPQFIKVWDDRAGYDYTP